jgi:O-methyltransferase
MKAIRLLGKAKGFFFLLRLNFLTPVKAFEFLAYLAKLSKWINKHSKTGFSDFYTFKFNYDKRYELFKYLIEKENLNADIDYLEFGVATGHSFRWWAKAINNDKARFYGFDTFSGLPENWGPFKKGDMSNNNEPPKMDDSRCQFFQGLFQQTLPGFLKAYQQNKRRIIHMDADLYSSTLYTLTVLSPIIKSGDIILFDEFNVPLHEFKAFSDWVQSYYIKYEVLGNVNNCYQTAVKIK